MTLNAPNQNIQWSKGILQEANDMECNRQEKISAMEVDVCLKPLHNFKVAPYHMAEGISPDTSKGHALIEISRSKRPKTFLELLTFQGSAKRKRFVK